MPCRSPGDDGGSHACRPHDLASRRSLSFSSGGEDGEQKSLPVVGTNGDPNFAFHATRIGVPRSRPIPWCRSTARRRLGCTVLSEPLRTAEWARSRHLKRPPFEIAIWATGTEQPDRPAWLPFVNLLGSEKYRVWPRADPRPARSTEVAFGPNSRIV
jgi:hypothetical protein